MPEQEHWSSPNGCHEDCPACAANVSVECDNCEFAGCKEDLNDIKDYSQRVDADGPEPEGECPKCGALCYAKADEEVQHCQNPVCEWEAIHKIEREGDTTLHLCHQCKTAFDMGAANVLREAAANTKALDNP